MPRRGRGVDVDRRRCGIDVDRYRGRPRRAHGSGSRHRGQRGDDDLVTGTDAERDEREAQCFGTRRDRDGVRATRRRGELGFEGLGLRAEEESARPQHARDRVTQVGFETRSAAGEIDDRQRAVSSQVPIEMAPIEVDGASDAVGEVGLG